MKFTGVLSLFLAGLAIAELPYNMPDGKRELERPHPPPEWTKPTGHHGPPPTGTGGSHPTGTGGEHHTGHHTGTGHPYPTGGKHTHVKEADHPTTFKTHTKPHGTGEPHGTGGHHHPTGTGGSYPTGTGGHGGHHTGEPIWHKPEKPTQVTAF